jgi:hypothetical protein
MGAGLPAHSRKVPAMQVRRQSVTLRSDQLALVILQGRMTGLDHSAVIRQCVSTSLAHLRGGPEYKQALEDAKRTLGEDQ